MKNQIKEPTLNQFFHKNHQFFSLKIYKNPRTRGLFASESITNQNQMFWDSKQLKKTGTIGSFISKILKTWNQKILNGTQRTTQHRIEPALKFEPP
jgi:hypothetical protein